MFGLTKGVMFAAGMSVTAVVAAATGALVYRAWHPTEAPAIAMTSPAPATPLPATPAVAPPPVVAASAPSVAAKNDMPSSGIGQSANSTALKPPPVQSAPPAFDIVRVEPTGDAVVAGRAAPNADVALLDRGAVIAEMKADSNGQFAFVPPRLQAGDHLLALGEKSGSGRVVSTQTVAVAVPKTKNPGGVVVALTEPDQPTRVLSDTVKPASVGGEPQKSSNAPTVTIRTVEMQEHGGFFATGSAAPGAEVKLYLNGSSVADVHAGKDGHWSLQVAKGMQPGSYAVRADEIDASSGKVIARVEVPFDYKSVVVAERDGVPAAPKAGVAAKDDTMPTDSVTATDSMRAGLRAGPGMVATGAAPAEASANDAIIDAISTLTVVHGDSLWRISRKVLGRGIRYTQIYAANVSQIRDPDLIYPGQVLVRPQSGVN